MDTSYQNTILEQWNQYGMHKLFDITQTNSNPQHVFNFIAGPPFCSGKLHWGHGAIETIKSTILNYKAMQGYQCTNKLGYDCHGVPIESIANRELNINSTVDLERIGIATFNQFCKNFIKQCERDWEPVYNKLGRWADFNNVYKTIDPTFMESVWWAFAELHRKGLIYRGYKITPYSYALQSPLSNFEASQNYKEVDCKSIYIRFEVLPEYQYNFTPTYLVAWTTTPWTLPANIALCVNPDLEYEYLEYLEDNTNTTTSLSTSQSLPSAVYILGKDKHIQSGLKITSPPIKTVKGRELIGIKYKPIYPTYKDYSPTENAFTVVADGYVKDGTTTGTNIVHLAPVFGEDDYRVCKAQNIITDELIPYLIPIDDNCKYFSTVATYAGMLVFDAEPLIIKELKANKTLIKIQQIRHEYPYCYRTDTPLVYRTYNSFYVNIQTIKARMLALNKEINWYPDTTGTKRFNNWIEDAPDWCISRSRYFGTPIPVWIAEDGTDMMVIKSIRQLENLSGLVLNDIHPEYVNDIIITNPDNGKKYKRIPDVFDCWFESGSVPFAQHHYPFENKSTLDEHIQHHGTFADFIAEGVDQTRGWFYTLLVLSTALFDITPARNIMSVGHILDEHRKKLSKKNKNYIDPPVLIDNYGADAIRLYLLQSPITTGEPLAFKEDDIKTINKDLIQFKNCVDFLIEHSTNLKLNSIDFDILAYQRTTNPMDKWIILHLNNITTHATQLLDNYNISKATRTVLDTIDDICNWYVKFNRDRLKGKSGTEEWCVSLSTLYNVITRYIILLAPMAPFITQMIYNLLQNIVPNPGEFVHMEKYNSLIPNTGILEDGNNYIETFELLKRVSKLVRSARMNTKTHTSSKTPIKSCEICMDNPAMLECIASCIELIQTELNIIDIKYGMLTGNLHYKIVPNRAVLGKKYKKNATAIYKQMETIQTDSNYYSAPLNITVAGEIYNILEDEFNYEPVFSDNDIFDNDGCNNILIKIDFTYDASIEKLAHLKRFVAEVQQTRKHMGLKPWNKIELHTFQDDFEIVSQNTEYIQKRLEYPVIPNSKHYFILEDIKTYQPDKDENKKINYAVNVITTDA